VTKKVTLGVFALSLVFLASGCGDSPDSVMKDMVNLTKEFADVMGGIKDKDSAEKAKSKLEDLATKMEKVAERARKIGKLDKNKREILEKKYKPELEETKKKLGSSQAKGAIPLEAVEEIASATLKFGVATLEVEKALGLEEK
jgi:hypothetical protein